MFDYNENHWLILQVNPTSSNASIQMSKPQENIEVRIYNSIGALIETKTYSFTDIIGLNMNYTKGNYFIHVFSDDFEGVLKLVKH